LHVEALATKGLDGAGAQFWCLRDNFLALLLGEIHTLKLFFLAKSRSRIAEAFLSRACTPGGWHADFFFHPASEI